MTALKVGAARVNITPPLGGEMAGYAARDRGSETVLDELHAKALFFDDGETRAAIITCDLIGLKRPFVEAVRAQVEADTEVPATNVMVSCSHTHFGPKVNGPDVDPYAQTLVQKLATAVQLARQNARPASVSFGVGRADGLSFNRHTLLPDGRAQTNYRMPADRSNLTFGSNDPTVRVARFDDDGATVASLLHFACHPVTTTDKMYAVSADYPGYAMGLVEREIGGLCLFGLGCAGNQVPIQREEDYPQRIGRSLGAEAIKTLHWTTPLDESPRVAVTHGEAAIRRKDGNTQTEPLQCIAVANARFVGLPGEVFTEIGFDIVARTGVDPLFLLSMTNGSVGYIPTAEAYPQGGYEVGASHFAQGCGEALADAVVTLLHASGT